MINGINSYQNYENTNSNSITATTKDKPSSTSNQSTEVSAPSFQASLYLSTKAQKLNALNNEFFKSGSAIDINALAERVYQYGLISKSEYEHFNGAEISESGIQEPEVTTTESLVNFIHQFQEKIDKTLETPDEYEEEEKNLFTVLTEALNTAATVLKDIEKSKNEPDFKQSIKQAITALKEAIRTEPFGRLTLDDQVDIVKITKSLDIIDKITPQRLTNDKINRYLDISMR